MSPGIYVMSEPAGRHGLGAIALIVGQGEGPDDEAGRV